MLIGMRVVARRRAAQSRASIAIREIDQPRPRYIGYAYLAGLLNAILNLGEFCCPSFIPMKGHEHGILGHSRRNVMGSPCGSTCASQWTAAWMGSVGTSRRKRCRH